MNGEFVFQWPMILYPLAALCYFELMRRLDNAWADRNPLSEEEILWNHARSLGISELEVFRRAAEFWTVGAGRVEEDFKSYLRQEPLPPYVRDYLRKIKPLFKAHR